MDEPWITVISEDDRFIFGEERVEVGITESVRMFGAGLQGHDVDDVDDADFQLRTMLSQHLDCGECFESWDIASAGHDDIWLVAIVIAGPRPNAETGGAMFDG